jgi:hypothetical protein
MLIAYVLERICRACCFFLVEILIQYIDYQGLTKIVLELIFCLK